MSELNVSTCLWFERDMEEAVNHYVSLFDDGRITDVIYWPEDSIEPAGTLLTMTFELAGRSFVALGGAPVAFNDAASIFVTCKTQEQVDRLWDGLLQGGGQEKMCGWLADRFGVTWQIVPEELLALITDADKEKAGRTMQAMMGMVKLDIAQLKAAHGGNMEKTA